MSILRYGILSTSSIAPRFIAAVRAAGAGEVVAVSSRTLEKAEEMAEAWQVPNAFGSHLEMLQDARINIVYISSVNSQHFPLAKLALEMGKHVVCEKPCTTSFSHTKELFALAREKGLFFMEAQKMLFLPVMVEVRKRICEGYLGQIHMAQMSHSFSAEYNAWQFDKALGGGTLLSSGIYAVELLLWLFGGIESVSGVKSAYADGTEWQYVLSGKMENGVLFSIKNSTRVSLDNTAYIYGTEGYVEIPAYWKARKATFYRNGCLPETVEFPCQYELIYEAEHIQKCIDNGITESPVMTQRLTLSGIVALEEIMRAWNDNK
ncbi:MAG: Gfo/Idh/MocA family oxidoreductase [Ruminococcaceae bacterium]|nr:Gfo/Idh/MocA family oxidoreductase [Oscillospiraceae bacterium]